MFDWKSFHPQDLISWGTALVMSFVIYGVLTFLRNFFADKLNETAHKTETLVDDMVHQVLLNLRRYFLFSVSVYIACFWLKFPERIRLTIDKAIIIIFLIQVGQMAGTVINFWVNNKLRAKAETNAEVATTVSLLNFVIRFVVYSILVILALNNMGVDVTALIAGLSVGGIAIAFALQNILTDLFSSLTIVLDKPFLVGDFIEVDGLSGTVEHIGLKTTRLRSLTGEQLIFGNGDLLKSRVRNYKRMVERRIVLPFRVTYQTQTELLDEIPKMVKEIVESQDKTRFDRCHFLRFGEYALEFDLVYWVLAPDFLSYADRAQKINVAIYKKFQEKGIEFALPARVVQSASK